jgi:chaperonin GroEL
MSGLAEIHALADAAAAKLGAGVPFAPPAGAWEERSRARVIDYANLTLGQTGDGAATTLVLARALLARALQHVAGGGDPTALKTELDAALELALAAVLAEARPLYDLADLERVVPMVSRVSPVYAQKIAFAAKMVGVGGSIVVWPSDAPDTRVILEGGVSFDEPWASPWFVTDSKTREVVLRAPYVLVVDGDLPAGAPLAPILGKVAQTGRPLLIVSGDLGEDALAMLAINRLSGACQVSASRGPKFGSARSAVLSDIAVVVGAKVVRPEAVSGAGLADLGEATETRQGQFSTAIICDTAAKLRAQALSAKLNDQAADVARKGDDRGLKEFQARIKRVDSGVAVVRLGSEDDPGPAGRAAAQAAALAAVEEGVVVGGGGALVRAGAALAGVAGAGARMLREAMEEPCRAIARNAGVDDEAVVRASANARSEFGFNADTGRFENLRTAGIVDLAMTVRWAIRAAVSTAGLSIRDEALVAEARSLTRIGLSSPASAPRPLAVEPGAVRDPAAEAAAPDVSVVLLDAGERSIRVTNEVMKANPGMSYAAATAVVKGAPKPIKSGLRPREAEKLRDHFVDLGAVVEIK